ncbi:hypothetical protein KC359_g56 [Hortaea werneckii]|nr:hypothetical protein KC359_g56 [Hortaea werneckii]
MAGRPAFAGVKTKKRRRKKSTPPLWRPLGMWTGRATDGETSCTTKAVRTPRNETTISFFSYEALACVRVCLFRALKRVTPSPLPKKKKKTIECHRRRGCDGGALGAIDSPFKVALALSFDGLLVGGSTNGTTEKGK